jgi:hypothetical protein
MRKWDEKLQYTSQLELPVRCWCVRHSVCLARMLACPFRRLRLTFSTSWANELGSNLRTKELRITNNVQQLGQKYESHHGEMGTPHQQERFAISELSTVTACPNVRKNG